MSDAGTVDPGADAQMVPMLPCSDIEEMERFWTALGLQVTYRQTRPNPYLALGRGGIDLHYYVMPGHEPDNSHSTCGLVVDETEPLHGLFADGFRTLVGRVPLSGTPRMTRPRRRANNAGLSGFSVIDPAGNWIRVSRRPDAGRQVRSVDDRLEWVSGGGPLARAVESAVVQADSHGDPHQAHRILAGALARGSEAPVVEVAAAWAYLAELRVRLGDAAGAREAAAELGALEGAELTGEAAEALQRARREVAELGLEG